MLSAVESAGLDAVMVEALDPRRWKITAGCSMPGPQELRATRGARRATLEPGTAESEVTRAGRHKTAGTWVETEAAIERRFATLPAALLGACFDIGHLLWADVDPVALLERDADRLMDVHIKDLILTIAAQSRATPTSYRAATDRGVLLEPGLGGIDLDAVLAALPRDFDGWIVVEVDRARMASGESASVHWRWVEERLH